MTDIETWIYEKDAEMDMIDLHNLGEWHMYYGHMVRKYPNMPYEQCEIIAHELYNKYKSSEAKRDRISIHWSVDDVRTHCDWLTYEQAVEVLNHMKRYHNPMIGITWDVIETIAQTMFANKENEDE